MLMSATKVICPVSYETDVDPDISSLGIEEGHPMLLTALVVHSNYSHDCHDDTFPPSEVIFETMSYIERPSEDLHYRPSSLPKLERTKHDESYSTLGEELDHLVLPLD